jgi:L-alanine-DL-glutamate epimerase-like enolase superfamily enzyme
MNGPDMTIADIRTTRIRIPFVEPPALTAEYNRPREILVIEVETKGGIVGMGYLHFLRPGMLTVDACLKEMIIPRLIGRDAGAVEGNWRFMWKDTYATGRMGPAMFAISAIDVALWDALGKRAGLPLHRLWGHYRAEVPAYGSGCWRGLGGDGMIAKAKRYVAEGYKAIKMQVGHLWTAATDVDNVRRMREALGPDIDIMIDVNMAWTADQAIIMGKKFEPYDIYWLEEPVIADDFAGYFRVADALNMRVVGGETHFTRYDMRPFFENPKIPILQPDVMRGGLTELRKIAAIADTWGMTLAPHLFSELMIQVMASIPNGLILEQMGFMDDLWIEPVLPVNGMVTAPERPGHGLAFKEAVLRDHRVKS